MNINKLIKELEELKDVLYVDVDVMDEAIRRVEDNEKLKQEIKNLKYKVLFLSETAIEEQQEVEAELEDFKKKYLNLLLTYQNLLEALRKCSPFATDGYGYDCQTYEKTYHKSCAFCDGKEYKGHTDDCEYVRLCGKDINVTTKNGGAE